MKSSLTIQIAEGLGNQIFMYAFAYALSKSFGYNLYIDNQSGYSFKKNTLRKHQKYMLDSFNIDQNYAPKEIIFILMLLKSWKMQSKEALLWENNLLIAKKMIKKV